MISPAGVTRPTTLPKLGGEPHVAIRPGGDRLRTDPVVGSGQSRDGELGHVTRRRDPADPARLDAERPDVPHVAIGTGRDAVDRVLARGEVEAGHDTAGRDPEDFLAVDVGADPQGAIGPGGDSPQRRALTVRLAAGDGEDRDLTLRHGVNPGRQRAERQDQGGTRQPDARTRASVGRALVLVVFACLAHRRFGSSARLSRRVPFQSVVGIWCGHLSPLPTVEELLAAGSW